MEKSYKKIKMGLGTLLLLLCLGQVFSAPCGDVDSNGIINIVDALMTAQYYVGLSPQPFDVSAAEVSGDGAVTVVDALQIAQYYVGLLTSFVGCAQTPTPSIEPVTYEMQAETEATWDEATIDTEYAGYTGSGYVNTSNSSGRWLQWDIDVLAAGSAICVFTFTNGSESNRSMDMSVNGNVVTSLSFPVTGAWDAWSTETATVSLDAGLNAIRLTATNSMGAPNMDKMDITLNAPTSAPTATPTPGPVITPGGPDPYGFANSPIGFASLNGGTTGGAGGQIVTVTNQADLERYAGATEPYIIKVQGSITISPFGKEVSVNSNKTVVGVGADATIAEGGFIVYVKKNVIIRNLTIRDSYVASDPAGETQDFDAVQVDTSQNIWLDHCHFTHAGDGLVDLRKDIDYVTVSWCIFSNHNKCFGVGWTDNTFSKLTLHHLWIHDTERRNPSFDMAMGHLYNNFLEDISAYGNWSRGKARVVIENSYYENVNKPWFVDSGAELITRGLIAVNCTGNQDGNRGSAFDPSSYYSYTLDPTESVPDLLRQYAGPNANIQY